MRRLEISKKNTHFCDVHFSLYKKDMFVKPCLKQHACLVDRLGVSCDFLNAHTLVFSDLQKGEPKPRKGLEIWLPHRNFEPPDLPKAPTPTEKRTKRVAIPSFGKRKGPWQASHPVFLFEDKEPVIKTFMQGTGPHTRHVSRTQRVDLDWFFVKRP